MNEEELADLLNTHLDRLLSDDASSEEPPSDLADLLAFAEDLTLSTPASRPEFAAALRESLLNSAASGFSIAESAASTPGSQPLTFWLLVGAVILIAGALLLGAIIFGASNRVDQPLPTTTPAPAATMTPTALPTNTPAPTATVVEAEPTTPPSVAPTGTSTPILDRLPTIVPTQTLPPPDLVPGEPSPGGSGGGSDSGGSSGSSGGDDDDDD